MEWENIKKEQYKLREYYKELETFRDRLESFDTDLKGKKNRLEKDLLKLRKLHLIYEKYRQKLNSEKWRIKQQREQLDNDIKQLKKDNQLLESERQKSKEAYLHFETERANVLKERIKIVNTNNALNDRYSRLEKARKRTKKIQKLALVE